MGPYILKRLVWMIPTLIGISFVTFLLMDLAPGDRVLREIERSPEQQAVGDLRQRAERVRRLKVKHGLIDPATGEELSLGVRYGRWLRNALVLDFAGRSVDVGRFHQRILDALPVTLLLNAMALVLALAVAIPLGVKAGMRSGGLLDRVTSTSAFVVYGLPEFLIATLLVLVFGGGFFAPILPVVGLQSSNAAQFGVLERSLDLLAHLCLPVFTLAVGYGVVVFRFLRESVARASASEFVTALRGLGVGEAVIQKRVLRNGMSPLVTLLGTMLPALVSGTVIVESIFALPGLGWLTTNAVAERDMSMVMALTMLVSSVTLFGLLLSDVLQRVIDPRVELR